MPTNENPGGVPDNLPNENITFTPGGLTSRQQVQHDIIVNSWVGGNLPDLDEDEDEDEDDYDYCDCSLCNPEVAEEIEPITSRVYDLLSRSNASDGVIEDSIEMPSMYSSLYGYGSSGAIRCSYCKEVTRNKDIKEISGLRLCPDCASKYKLTCKSCGEKILYRDADNFVYYQGTLFCKKCCEICEHCNKTKVSQLFREVDGTRYCTDCFRLKFFHCSGCNKIVKLNMGIIVGGEGGYTVCNNCYEENYFTCIECDNIFLNDSLTRDGMCFHCARRTGHIHTCDYKPPPVFHGNHKLLMMGVELEVEKKRGGRDVFACAQELFDMSDSENYFYIKEDGSLNNGLEIVSHPMTLDYHKKFEWNKIFNACVSQGFNSHNTTTCGLHVHVSRNFFSFLDCIRLGMFVAFHKEKFETLSRRKEDYDYAKFKHVGKGNLRSASQNDDNRYEAVNWTNSKTIEFRMFRGTLLHETFLSTLELVDAVSHFVKTVNTNQIYGVNQPSTAWELFCSFINRDRKTYKLLISYMIEKGVYTCA